MNWQSFLRKAAVVAGSMLMMLLAAALAYGVVYDYQSRVKVTNGVTVAGKDLSDMTAEQVREVIEGAVTAPMLQPVTVDGDRKTWTFDPQGVVAVDVDAMLAQAYAPRISAPFIQRLYSDLADTPIPGTVKPQYSVDEAKVRAWVARTAEDVDRAPVNATRKVVDYKFEFTPSARGAKVVQFRAVGRITKALSAEAALSQASRVVTLPVDSIKPKVVESSFKKAIIVSLPACEIRLYNGTKLERTYPCAPGRAAFPTPQGDFVVNQKLANAPWYNPGSAWAKSMPPMIPAGPNNPMGVRKIGINYSGVFMHGIPPGEFGSIGTHASHGCMRMYPRDVLDLFGRVEIGTPVFIRG